MNLSAYKLAGLVLFPYVLMQIKELWKSAPIKLIILNITYLGILAIVYGHIIPWVDETGLKAGRDVPQWRSIIHMGSMGLEYTSTIYLAMQFKHVKNALLSLKVMSIGAFASFIAAVIENFAKFDFYSFFTAQPATYIENRMKGFNYEPRGFGQTVIYGAISALSYGLFHNKKYLILVPFLLAGLFVLTLSTSGIILFVVGFTTFLVLFFLTSNLKLKRIFQISGVVLLLGCGLFYVKKDKILHHFSERWFLYQDTKFVEKFEVLDAAALNFLFQNPKHLVVGTGPGLVMVPVGKKYMVRQDHLMWPDGLVALPHMGGVLVLSNGGILGVILWFLPILYCLRRAFYTLRENKNDPFKLPILIGATFIMLYLFQIRYPFYLGYAMLLGFNFAKEEGILPESK